MENFLATLDTNQARRATPKPLPPLPDPLPHAKFSRAQVREMTERRKRANAQEQERARRAGMGAASVSSLTRDVAGLMRAGTRTTATSARGGGSRGVGSGRPTSRRSPNSTLESAQALDGGAGGVNGAGYSDEDAPVKWSKKSGDGVGARRTKGAMAGAIGGGAMDGGTPRGPNYVPGGASPVAFMSPGRPSIVPASPSRRSARSLG